MCDVITTVFEACKSTTVLHYMNNRQNHAPDSFDVKNFTQSNFLMRNYYRLANNSNIANNLQYVYPFRQMP